MPFAALGHCLKCSCCCGVCGFSRRWSASICMIVLNTLLPLVGPPFPCRLLPKFSAQKDKEHELWSFQSIPLLINSINLKRDGVRICLGKDVRRWNIEGFLTPPSFRYRVNYIGYRGGPHMRSLISIDFLAQEMEPESAHVVSAVSVPSLQCGDLRCSTTQATFTNPSLLRATPLLRAMFSFNYSM